MTKQEIAEIRRRLNSHGRPMVTLRELSEAMGLQYQTLWNRLRDRPELKRPPTMRCGGAEMAVLDSALDWAIDHLTRWEAIQAEKAKAA